MKPHQRAPHKFTYNAILYRRINIPFTAETTKLFQDHNMYQWLPLGEIPKEYDDNGNEIPPKDPFKTLDADFQASWEQKILNDHRTRYPNSAHFTQKYQTHLYAILQ